MGRLRHAEVAAGRDGHVGALHDLEGEIPAVLHAQALADGGAVGPCVERPVGHHRHVQAHGLQLREEPVAAGLEFGPATLVFSDPSNAIFTYSAQGVSGAKYLTREAFSSPATVCR